jgi:hypothetical protein
MHVPKIPVQSLIYLAFLILITCTYCFMLLYAHASIVEKRKELQAEMGM